MKLSIGILKQHYKHIYKQRRERKARQYLGFLSPPAYICYRVSFLNQTSPTLPSCRQITPCLLMIWAFLVVIDVRTCLCLSGASFPLQSFWPKYIKVSSPAFCSCAPPFLSWKSLDKLNFFSATFFYVQPALAVFYFLLALPASTWYLL